MKTFLNLFILYTLTINLTVYAQQHALNTDSIFKLNKVKSLTVLNCLETGCIKDYYEFNGNGQMTKHSPSIVNFYWTWEYYKNGKLKSTYSKQHCCDSDTIWNSKHYNYKLNGKLDYLVNKQYENGIVIKSDTIRTEEKTKNKRRIQTIRNSKNQITEQKLNDLFYPCGIIYRGKHTIKYSYTNDGLIASGKIYNEDNQLIVDLKYEYLKY